MKIGIYGSMNVGCVHDDTIDYIGVDQGVYHLYHQGITPIIAIGDMDSIEDDNILNHLQIRRYSSIKDDTDTALAIQYAIDHGYDCIDLYGVTHQRMDHFMAVLCLLEKYQDIAITVYDEWNKIFVLKPGKHQIFKEQYYYFSIFAFDESVITLTDCHYPLQHYHLKRNDPLCVSNQMNGEYAYIENSQTILFIQSRS
ncbi:thiamine diphosphokinase [Allocoprobacillus halotolerans]|uniref:Thiamine diphosphokinase n=1 Tax=Allocoprobacillus halotolerans TaxID=2944914 RepID=A0ABY5I3B4_9FIRM|nr:thiamine diphosphokinase [Allocoprobacillus halotolerans]UTY38879.1 thiamine diphosphokinase [Allocoprobacillus halotolerans]